MMSFFKKEHNKDPREDKEKKKVDKKNIFNNSKMNDTFNETSNMSLIIEGQSISITNSNNETSNNNLHCSSYVSLSPKLSSSSKSSIDSSNLALQQKNQLHSTALGVPSIAPKPKKGNNNNIYKIIGLNFVFCGVIKSGNSKIFRSFEKMLIK
jgi:hypothetical protein